MIAQITVNQVATGNRKTIDALDVVDVEETRNGTKIRYMPCDSLEDLYVMEAHDDIIKDIAEAIEKAKQRPGDNWK
jgi:hypothetical protein